MTSALMIRIFVPNGVILQDQLRLGGLITEQPRCDARTPLIAAGAGLPSLSIITCCLVIDTNNIGLQLMEHHMRWQDSKEDKVKR